MTTTAATGPVKFAAISENTDAANELVEAVTSRKIRVLAIALMVAGAVNVTLQDDTGTPVVLIGLLPFAAAGDTFILPYNPCGWCETSSGQALDLLLSAAVAVTGCLVYQEVK